MTWTLVTGGAKRLGKHIAVALAKNRYHVLIHYRKSRSEAFQVVEECRSYGVKADCLQGDFSGIESLNTFITDLKQAYPDISNLVNNVGSYHLGSPLETPLSTWMNIFQTNLFSAIAITQNLRQSIEESTGAIINFGVAGLARGADCYSSAYTSAKQSLLFYTRSLALEMAPKNVRVNMISPGYLENSVDLPKDISKLPMGRPGTLEETAKLVVFLLSEQTRYVTGQNIEIAGGVRL